MGHTNKNKYAEPKYAHKNSTSCRNTGATDTITCTLKTFPE
jgi:hypothetical protein